MSKKSKAVRVLPPTTSLLVRFDREFADRAAAIARLEQRSMTAMVVAVLEEYVREAEAAHRREKEAAHA